MPANGIAVGLTLGWIYTTHLSTRFRHSACPSLWWLAVMTHSTLSWIANYFSADCFSYGRDLIAIPEGERGTQSNKQHRGERNRAVERGRNTERCFFSTLSSVRLVSKGHKITNSDSWWCGTLFCTFPLRWELRRRITSPVLPMQELFKALTSDKSKPR